MSKRDLTKLTKKELKEMRDDARDIVGLCYKETEYDDVILPICVNGYVSILSTMYIDKQIFLDKYNRILEILMRNLSSLNITREYLYKTDVNFEDVGSSYAFYYIMRLSHYFDNPYLRKCDFEKMFLIDDMREVASMYLHKTTSDFDSIETLIGECYIGIDNLRKRFEARFFSKDSVTHDDGILWLIRKSLECMKEAYDDDMDGVTIITKKDHKKKTRFQVDWDVWNKLEKELEYAEKVTMSKIVTLESYESLVKKHDDEICIANPATYKLM